MSAPASYNSPARRSVRPKPCAAFSALTMARSIARSRFSPGRCALIASRPERPTTSPQRRMFKRASSRQWLPQHPSENHPIWTAGLRPACGRFGHLASRIAGGANAAALLLQRLVGIRQFVGDDEGRQEDQPCLADLPQILGELDDLGVDVLRQAADPRLLPVGAAEGKVAAV